MAPTKIKWSSAAHKTMLRFLHNYDLTGIDESKIKMNEVYTELIQKLTATNCLEECTALLSIDRVASHTREFLNRLSSHAKPKTVLIQGLSVVTRSVLADTNLFSKDELNSIYSNQPLPLASATDKPQVANTSSATSLAADSDASSELSSQVSGNDQSHAAEESERGVSAGGSDESSRSRSRSNATSANGSRKRKAQGEDNDESNAPSIDKRQPKRLKPTSPGTSGSKKRKASDDDDYQDSGADEEQENATSIDKQKTKRAMLVFPTTSQSRKRKADQQDEDEEDENQDSTSLAAKRKSKRMKTSNPQNTQSGEEEILKNNDAAVDETARHIDAAPRTNAAMPTTRNSASQLNENQLNALSPEQAIPLLNGQNTNEEAATDGANVSWQEPSKSPQQDEFQVEKLHVVPELPSACDDSDVASVMVRLYMMISNAIDTLCKDLAIHENHPVYIDNDTNLPPKLCHLLSTILGGNPRNAKSQACSFLGAGAQRHYNLAVFLKSLGAAAVYEWCLRPLPQGENYLQKVEDGDVRTTLQRVLSPSDYLRVEFEITQEHVKNRFKPRINQRAGKLALDLTHMLAFVLPRYEPRFNGINILNNAQLIDPTSTMPDPQSSANNQSTSHSKWLKNFENIFIDALNWRADAEIAGNAAFQFEFPCYGTPFERSYDELQTVPTDSDNDPNARVIMCLMPRVLRKVRRYVERALSREKFRVAFEGKLLVGGLK